MKKLTIVLAAIAISASAYAQTDSTNNRNSPPNMNNSNDDRNRMHDDKNENRDTKDSRIQNSQREDNRLTDGVVMQNGKVMIVKSGKMTPMEKDLTMSNGTKVMRDGSYMHRDGKKVMLKEGEHLDMGGKISPTRTDKDKNMYLVPNNSDKK